MAIRTVSRQKSEGFDGCVVCDQLSTDSAGLLHDYNAAIDTLAATSRKDPGYEDRWESLSSVSDRLCAAQKVEAIHHMSHRAS
jgi:hypothetical protein